jgi:hypothetical protein
LLHPVSKDETRSVPNSFHFPLQPEIDKPADRFGTIGLIVLRDRVERMLGRDDRALPCSTASHVGAPGGTVDRR